eukprot:TRINITY_DN2685_c0_g1_i1.p1 TRINITY_DN2685_c0_g1~~TRINITY_DN2685_c0_g1_i1.p1  ORF type:complete len:386 (-),score=63.25 TRINITY_DN2685_c0_g1_i1:831-1988(-)
MNGVGSISSKEILDLYEKLQSAANGANEGEVLRVDEEQRAVDLLERLGECKVNHDILASTQVGKKVRKLSKHRSPKIASAATVLVDNWKEQLLSESSAKGISPDSLDSPSTPNPKNSSPKPIQKSLLSQKSSESSLKPSPKSSTPQNPNGMKPSEASQKATPQRNGAGASTNGTMKPPPPKNKSPAAKEAAQSPSSSTAIPLFDVSKVPKVGVLARDKFRELVGVGLAMVANELADEHRMKACHAEVVRVLMEVELEMFKVYGGGKRDQEYKAKYRQLTFNLKDRDNPDLRRRVLFGEITPSELLTMTTEDMASDERKREKMKIEQKMMFETTRGINMTSSTDQFKCGKCGQRKTTYYQMQTRSADEPMTTFVSCLNCPNRWKFC